MIIAYCPECSRQVPVENPYFGQRVPCSHCQTELEVIHLDPLQLDWLEDEGDLYASQPDENVVV